LLIGIDQPLLADNLSLEAEVEQRFKPASMHRVYKENTWAPAPKADVEKLIEETDYVLVGLGA
jgi:hypothetical protein